MAAPTQCILYVVYMYLHTPETLYQALHKKMKLKLNKVKTKIAKLKAQIENTKLL